MPLRPSKNTSTGGSGSGGSSSSPYVVSYYSDLVEVNNSVGSYDFITIAALSSGLFSISSEADYDGQLTVTSSTTAISGGSIRIGNTNIFPKTGDIARFWFKTPASVDSASVLNFGFSDSLLASPQNFVGFQLSGSSARGLTISSGSSTQSGSSYTVSAGTRYCAEVKYTSDTQVSIKLYSNSDGSELFSTTMTTSSGRRVPIAVAVNTGTVAKDIITADAIDFRMVKRGKKLPE